MPSENTKFKDKAKYDQAIASIKKQYPDMTSDDPKYWKLITALYEKLGGEFSDVSTGLTIPPEAYVPSGDLWVHVFKGGKWTPGNTGVEEVWDSKRLEKVVSNTKQSIAIGNYPTINIDHVRQGPAYGLISDVKLDGDNIFAKVHYLTKEIASDMMAGKYPFRSSEIFGNEDKSEELAGVALLGAARPAVKGLEQVDFNNFSEALNGAEKEKIQYIYEESNNPKEFGMSKEINNNTEKLFTEADLKGIVEKVKVDLLKEFTDQQIKDKERIFRLEQDNRRREIELDINSLSIPSNIVDKKQLTEFLSAVSDNDKVLEFKDGEGKEQKLSMYAFTINLLNKVNKVFSKLSKSIIDRSSVDTSGADTIYYKPLGENAEADRYIKSFAIKNKLDYAAAFNELVDKGVIRQSPQQVDEYTIME